MSKHLSRFVTDAIVAISGLIGVFSLLAWVASLLDNQYAEHLKDIDPTPHLSLIIAMLCLLVISIERLRKAVIARES